MGRLSAAKTCNRHAMTLSRFSSDKKLSTSAHWKKNFDERAWMMAVITSLARLSQFLLSRSEPSNDARMCKKLLLIRRLPLDELLVDHNKADDCERLLNRRLLLGIKNALHAEAKTDKSSSLVVELLIITSHKFPAVVSANFLDQLLY